MPGPGLFDPVYLPDDPRARDLGLEFRVRELEPDDGVAVVPFGALKKGVPFFHGHGQELLGSAIKDVDASPGTYGGAHTGHAEATGRGDLSQGANRLEGSILRN